MTGLSREQYARENAMRVQDYRYIAAVYSAHPEFFNEGEGPQKFDEYPSKTHGIPSMEAVALEVAKKHNVTLAALRGHSQGHQIVAARHDAMVAVATLCHQGVTAVGRFFRRDHSVVAHALRKAEGNPRICKPRVSA
jgi:hypothetical protein